MIAICLCSRGLVHSRTAEAIEQNRLDVRPTFPTHLLFTHDKPIPEAQNDITRAALAIGADWMWFVEEDMLPGRFVLGNMLDCAHDHHADVVVADYRLKTDDFLKSVCRDRGGRFLFSGMGCMLARRTVFLKIPAPWFDTDTFCVYKDTGEFRPRHERASYGGQDVYFFAKCHKAGITVAVVDNDAQHIRLRNDAIQRAGNDGVYDVEIL